jgi:cysteine-rich repeat protein
VRIGLSPTGGIAFNGARQPDGKLVIAGLNGSPAIGPLALVRLGGDCGDGTVAGLEQCDDGNAVAGDCCDLACQPEPALQPCPSASLCLAHRCDGAGKCGVPEPPTNCTPSLQAGKSTIALKRTAGGSNDTLTWKLRKGGVTPLAALGDPYVSTAYALCGYGPGPSLLFELDAPPGDVCAGRACWSLLGRTGFTYRDRDRTPNGLDLLRVRSGDAGRVSMIAKGKGSSLALPPLPMALPATVQLRTSDGVCWETIFSSTGAVRNDDAQFKGRAD